LRFQSKEYFEELSIIIKNSCDWLEQCLWSMISIVNQIKWQVK
jgi:hypothetical protein